MSTPAYEPALLSEAKNQTRVAANQAHCKLSTGPTSEAGRAISCMNNLRHGLAGKFSVMPSEDQTEFEALAEALRQDHQPATVTEEILVQRMAEHHWLVRRAQMLQTAAIEAGGTQRGNDNAFALFLRYETTNERAFHKCVDQLLKLRAEKRKARLDEAALSRRAEDLKNGFESQKRKQAEEARKQAEEVRKQEAHQARVRLANSKAGWQELNTEIKGTIEAVLPGHTRIDFEQLKPVLSASIREAVTKKAA